MSQDSVKDAKSLFYPIALLLIICVWESVNIITDYIQGDIYMGSVTGAYNSLNETDNNLSYAIEIKRKNTVIAEFTKPVYINQKVYVFCTISAFEKASRCSGYADAISKTEILIGKLKYIPIILLVIYLINIYRKYLLKKAKLETKKTHNKCI
tara:strand:+ start:71 stop:529 length:459 start_codon:yes stop_codon:yes gene_type:complete